MFYFWGLPNVPTKGVKKGQDQGHQIILFLVKYTVVNRVVFIPIPVSEIPPILLGCILNTKRLELVSVTAQVT